jgi:hypothetical protein
VLLQVRVLPGPPFSLSLTKNLSSYVNLHSAWVKASQCDLNVLLFENDPTHLRKTISALAKLDKIINSDANILELKLAPGELLMVNNHRVLHGRKAFTVGAGHRHFQQVYMEVDDIEAKWRCL